MKFSPMLRKAKLLRRYKRFLGDAELGGHRITAHCPNPGSMLGHCDGGQTIWLAPCRGGKLRWRWELSGDGRAITGVNTLNANRIAAEALAADGIAELAGYKRILAEQKIGNSRLDFVLGDGELCYVEVKSVTLSRKSGLAEFPDAVTARGRKHLMLLAQLAKKNRAVMLFIIQRQDCEKMAVAADIDGGYAEGMKEALAAGVEALAYDCVVGPQLLEINRKLPFISDKWPG